jgi:hypothetical protein
MRYFSLLLILATITMSGCGNAITLPMLRQQQAVEVMLSQMKPPVHAKTSFGPNNTLFIEIDAEVENENDFKKWITEIHNHMAQGFQEAMHGRHPERKPLSFVVKTKNLTITIP